MSREYALHEFRPPVDLRIDYARELNPQQLAAVTATPGPALVIAGAGSGKTRTLTYRVAWLLEQGIPAERMLLLTFTNKAASEMMRRVGDLLGSDLSALWGGTFHSVGHRFLRRHADVLGWPRDFTIMDREDAADLIKACLDESKIDMKATRFPKADVLGEIFSLAVNTGRSVGELLRADYDYFTPLEAQIVAVHTSYVERRRTGGLMDFDDLLALWLRVLRDHADIRESYQRRFQFVLVDEYQDTNKLQGELIDLLAARHNNVMAVGDDSQSIYSWRGANFRNILEFPKRYPGATIYKIETNYRSTPEILSLANAAIAPNIHQFAKQLAAARPSGPRPVLVACGDGAEQAAFVAQRALELRDEGFDLRDMAVLYRSHFHSLELQLELTRRNIPFSITSGVRFFEQAHIKDVAAHLKLVANPRDELAFKRLIRMLPGIGGKTADKLWAAFSSRFRLPGSGAASVDVEPGSPTTAPRLARALQSCGAAIPRKTAVAWAQFAATMSQLEAPGTLGNTEKMIALVVEAGYEDHLKANFANYRARMEDIEQLAVFSRRFPTLEDFLTQLALLTNVDAEEQDSKPDRDDERLRLSTIHQAKGLEFRVVFVIMLCEGMFPNARALNAVDGEEEERRLFYVAITRAKDELYLSHPLLRSSFGGGAEMQQSSRFLRELPRELLEEWDLRPSAAMR